MAESFVWLLFELSLVLAAAKLGGLLAREIHLPVVLGELFAGLFLGNLGYWGIGFFEGIRNDPSLATLAELGVILLMFEVGVESTVPELARVGWSALLVALLGVIAPFLLGVAAVRLLFPGLSLWVGIFLGATLSATSVGISARVLKDLDKVNTAEGRTILGAAVVDDVLGLMILAVVVALIGSASSSGLTQAAIGSKVLVISLKAIAFLAGGIVLGVLFSKPLYRAVAKLKVKGMLLTLSLTLCFSFAFVAHKFGLAPIVGAFSAGLILEREHSRIFFEMEQESLEHLLLPLSTLFVPIFFFHVGMQVDVAVLLSPEALLLGLALSIAAIAGKTVCAAGIVSGKGSVDRWTVALGMIPRGEVGLIFAGIGARLEVGGVPLLDPSLYAAIIMMILVTTAMTPPLLAKRLEK
ncbi:MAG: cation:proton antiporter [Planctomycetaceae bacterium]